MTNTNQNWTERLRKFAVKCMLASPDTSDLKEAIDEGYNFIQEVEQQAYERGRREVAQECYNQCLVVECGEGECAEAIGTKFPKYVFRFDDPLKSKLTQEHEVI